MKSQAPKKVRKIRTEVKTGQPGVAPLVRPPRLAPAVPLTRSGTATLLPLAESRLGSIQVGPLLVWDNLPATVVLVRSGIDRDTEKWDTPREVPIVVVSVLLAGRVRELAMAPGDLCEVIEDAAARPGVAALVAAGDAYGEANRPELWQGEAEAGKTTQKQLRGEA